MAETVVGEIIYQGESPFLVLPAQPTTVRVAGLGVEMTVYASAHGKPPHAVQIRIPMTPDEARRLSEQLGTCVDEVMRKRR
jgi:hypothetical protein